MPENWRDQRAKPSWWIRTEVFVHLRSQQCRWTAPFIDFFIAYNSLASACSRLVCIRCGHFIANRFHSFVLRHHNRGCWTIITIIIIMWAQEIFRTRERSVLQFRIPQIVTIYCQERKRRNSAREKRGIGTALFAGFTVCYVKDFRALFTLCTYRARCATVHPYNV